VASLYFSAALESAAIGSTVVLLGDEARHAASVARARVGERISVGNGRGLVVVGPITSVSPSEVAVAVEEAREESLANPELWLIQALAKGDRDERAVQAATELGVSGVIPWTAERSVSRWDGAKADKGRARWEAIVREASKQSIRAWVPSVESVASTKSIASLPGLILVLEPTASTRITDIALPADGRLSLVVGPEGGLSPRELEIFEQSGAVLTRLGSEVLRTSTAGPAALAVLNARLSRW
jgi:16S rRNA (uracil1498-N3)-methyltransferase